MRLKEGGMPQERHPMPERPGFFGDYDAFYRTLADRSAVPNKPFRLPTDDFGPSPPTGAYPTLAQMVKR